jgi:peptidoglycan-associated lipoprotein
LRLYEMKIFKWIGLAVLLALLVGCGGSSGTAQPDDDLFGAYGGEGDQDGSATSGMSGDGVADGSEFGTDGGGPMAGPGADLENRVIYFEFDRSDVPADYVDLLKAHGEYLSANPSARIRLEGHADERGSREYNIGLGERRAQAVRQLLLLQGAAMDQLSTVSYGEERPAVLGSDDEAWGLNRRVELVYGR